MVSSTNQTKAALEYYKKAKEDFRKVGCKLGEAAVIQSEANIRADSGGERQLAEDLFCQSQEMLEEVFKDLDTSTKLVKVKEARANNLRSLKREVEADDSKADELIKEADAMKVKLGDVNKDINRIIRSQNYPATGES